LFSSRAKQKSGLLSGIVTSLTDNLLDFARMHETLPGNMDLLATIVQEKQAKLVGLYCDF
jgi:hypothetical protein